jgi:hypothetical protein
MSFPNPTESHFPSQESASQGGLIRRISAFFTTAIQLPPPPGPEPASATLEQFGLLLLALLLIFALVLLALPQKWSQQIIQVAFCIGKGR